MRTERSKKARGKAAVRPYVSLLQYNDMVKIVHCTVFDRRCAAETVACRK